MFNITTNTMRQMQRVDFHFMSALIQESCIPALSLVSIHVVNGRSCHGMSGIAFAD